MAMIQRADRWSPFASAANLIAVIVSLPLIVLIAVWWGILRCAYPNRVHVVR